MEREIVNVLNCGDDDEILTSAFKLNITRGDIQRLRGQQWLNDVVKYKFSILVKTLLTFSCGKVTCCEVQ